jgi:hypothetical protein
MVVYVVPIPAGAGLRYELYCPTAGEVDEETPVEQAGAIARFRRRFADTIRDAEQRQRDEGDAPSGVAARLKERMLGWIAERVAEQRLLWNLRRETAVVLAHADDTPFDDVMAMVRAELKGDYERHRRWLVIDGTLLLLSGLLALIPGPNLVAYFFIFRVGGHWFSMRGASQGLARIDWSSRPEPALRELRAAVLEEPRGQSPRIVPVAEALDLPDLPAFVARVTAGG